MADENNKDLIKQLYQEIQAEKLRNETLLREMA